MKVPFTVCVSLSCPHCGLTAGPLGLLPREAGLLQSLTENQAGPLPTPSLGAPSISGPGLCTPCTCSLALLMSSFGLLCRGGQGDLPSPVMSPSQRRGQAPGGLVGFESRLGRTLHAPAPDQRPKGISGVVAPQDGLSQLAGGQGAGRAPLWDSGQGHPHSGVLESLAAARKRPL